GGGGGARAGRRVGAQGGGPGRGPVPGPRRPAGRGGTGSRERRRSVTVTPVDAAARDEIRDVHDTTLFVEAGAGTGKTTALVDRVVALIARGRGGIRELAAITFTEAAAGGLRDPIRFRPVQGG